jgi:hypothetical protein
MAAEDSDALIHRKAPKLREVGSSAEGSGCVSARKAEDPPSIRAAGCAAHRLRCFAVTEFVARRRAGEEMLRGMIEF